jgi:hypothetical protein
VPVHADPDVGAVTEVDPPAGTGQRVRAAAPPVRHDRDAVAAAGLAAEAAQNHDCLHIGPPADERSRPRMIGLPTRIIAAGGRAGSTTITPCPVTTPAHARDQRPNIPGLS